MAAARRYLEPVVRHSTPVAAGNVREDPNLIDGHIEEAAVYVDMQDHQEWIDCFKINGDTYDMTVCPCHHLLPGRLEEGVDTAQQAAEV